MVPYPPPGDSHNPAGMARVVARNIQALLARRHAEDQARWVPDRMADGITRFTGSMAFIFIHLVAYGLWVAVNLGWSARPHVPRFDPSFVILGTEASVEAIFLFTFTLISQNRMAALADKRADLDLQVSDLQVSDLQVSDLQVSDLQVSLLAEHEVTRLISLVTAAT